MGWSLVRDDVSRGAGVKGSTRVRSWQCDWCVFGSGSVIRSVIIVGCLSMAVTATAAVVWYVIQYRLFLPLLCLSWRGLFGCIEYALSCTLSSFFPYFLVVVGRRPHLLDSFRHKACTSLVDAITDVGSSHCCFVRSYSRAGEM